MWSIHIKFEQLVTLCTQATYAIGKVVARKKNVLIHHHHFQPIEFITVNARNLISLSSLISGQSAIALAKFISTPLKRPLSFFFFFATLRSKRAKIILLV